jgi:hypothetical protein
MVRAVTNDEFQARDAFLWGASTAAHQVEGGNINSDWWVRENAPDRGHITEPSLDAADSYHRNSLDMQLLADAGLTAYRFSIEWARIEPEPGLVSRAQLLHCRRMVETARSLGLEPLVTLHHFTNPRWFADLGGWRAPDAVQRFRSYVEAALSVVEGVRYVCTFNEPNMTAVLASEGAGESFQAGMLPPGDPQVSATGDDERRIAYIAAALQGLQAAMDDGGSTRRMVALPRRTESVGPCAELAGLDRAGGRRLELYGRTVMNLDAAALAHPDRMDTGDGAGGEDHARAHRLTPADQDIQGGSQAMMDATGQVRAGSFPDELVVDVQGQRHRRFTGLVRQHGAEHQSVVVPEVGGDHRGAERVDVRDRAAGHLDADEQLLLQARRRLGRPVALGMGGQVTTDPDDQFGFHGGESGGEDADLGGRGLVLGEL